MAGGTTTTAEDESSKIASEVLSACIGGAVSASVLYPLEVLKTKMQAATDDDDNDDNDDGDDNQTGDDGTEQKKKTKKEGEKNDTMITYGRYLYEKHGISVFLHGIEYSAFQSALEKACYFFAYTLLKNGYSSIAHTKHITAFPNLVLGALAEWAHLPVTLPVDAFTTAIQTRDDRDTTSTGGNNTTTTSFQILLHMIGDKNTKWYSGIQAYWLLCWKPALQYTVYEQVKWLYLRRKSQKRQATGGSSSTGRRAPSSASATTATLTAAESFLLGMIARTVATVLVFPFLRAKVLMQTQSKSVSKASKPQDEGETANGANGDKGRESDTTNKKGSKDRMNGNGGILELLLRLYAAHGIRKGWFQGITPELTRGVFSAALMLTIKEKIAVLVQEYLVPTTAASKATTRRSLRMS